VADFGTHSVRDLDVTIERAAPGPMTHTETSYHVGTFPVRFVGGGAEGTIIEVEVVVPAPPSTNGIGDWPMRFFAGELGDDEAGQPPTVYICPDNCRLYLRYYEIHNASPGPTDLKLFLGDPDEPYEQINDTLSSGQQLASPTNYLYVLGPGEQILASSTDAGVFAHFQGVETVLA
jgi:hypothetical protein